MIHTKTIVMSSVIKITEVEGEHSQENLEEKIMEESKEESKETMKLWVDVLSNNRNPANGMVIEYVAPKLVNGEIEIKVKDSIEDEMFGTDADYVCTWWEKSV